MASPVDANRIATNIATAADPWTVTWPTGITAGQLLILFMKLGAPTSAGLQVPGWTSLVANHVDGGFYRNDIWYRWSDGTETGTFSLDLVSAQKGAVIIWRITGAANPSTQAPQAASGANFTTTANTANPASISPTGGSKDYLFLILAGCDGETQTFSHATYTNVTNANSGTAGAVATNVRTAGGSLQKTTATEDPAVFTHAAANAGGAAWTIAIHPAAPAGPATLERAVALTGG